jgi:hypothetical protein
MNEDLKAIATKELASVADQLPTWIRNEAQRIARLAIAQYLNIHEDGNGWAANRPYVYAHDHSTNPAIRNLVHETLNDWIEQEARAFVKEASEKAIRKVTKQSLQSLIQREVETQWQVRAQRQAAKVAKTIVDQAAKELFGDE